MKPPIAAAAWTTGALIDTSMSRWPSLRRHSSTVIGHGHAGSSSSQRCAYSGPKTASSENSTSRPAIEAR